LFNINYIQNIVKIYSILEVDKVKVETHPYPSFKTFRKVQLKIIKTAAKILSFLFHKVLNFAIITVSHMFGIIKIII